MEQWHLSKSSPRLVWRHSQAETLREIPCRYVRNASHTPYTFVISFTKARHMFCLLLVAKRGKLKHALFCLDAHHIFEAWRSMFGAVKWGVAKFHCWMVCGWLVRSCMGLRSHQGQSSPHLKPCSLSHLTMNTFTIRFHICWGFSPARVGI